MNIVVEGAPIAKKGNYKHGHWVGKKPTKVWRAWKEIHRRCSDPKRGNFKWYGAKGITVSHAWDSFETFYADMGEPPSDKHSLDRIDSSKGYGPGNCRWATMKRQQNNRTNNRLFTYKGETKTLAQWSDKLGIPYSCLYRRLVTPAKPWTIEEAFTKPRKGKKK